MTVRNPLVRDPTTGKIVELAAGDTIGGAPTGAAGDPGINWLGAWSSSTTYQIDDAVSVGGSSYICILSNTNQTPPNATYWNLLASKGDTGATGSTGPAGPAGGFAQLSQVVTASSQATVDFTSISGSYSALKVLYISRDTASGTSFSRIRLKVNNDGTAANYTVTQRSGAQNAAAFGSTTASSTKGVEAGFHPNDGNTGGIAGAGEVTLVGYASTTWMKRIFGVCGSDDATNNGVVVTFESRWASTSAITRLTFSTDGTAFKDGSIFTLYGLQ